MNRILIAPDKFKGSLTAVQVADRLAAGLRAAHPEVEPVLLPVADGGDGTVDAAVAAGFTRRSVRVTGPTGAPVDADFAVRGDTAVVELARASGLSRLAGARDPLHATSRGTGEVLLAVRELGCRRVVLGLGGSACTDGGAGMLQALGVRLRDGAGAELPPGGAALRNLTSVDDSGVTRDWRGVDVIMATDVDNPLLGIAGAAAVYGPQKGATPSDIDILTAGLDRFADVLRRQGTRDHTESPGAGAAGGVGFGALTFLRARRVSGIALLLDLIGFADRLAGASLVITGEGRLDVQTLHGKAPAGVAARARQAGVPTVAVAGRSDLSRAELTEAGIVAAYPLSDLEPDPERSIRNAGPLLERIAARIDIHPAAPDRRYRAATADE